MRFSTRDLLIFTGCLAGYLAFLVTMFRMRTDDPEWMRMLAILLPLPLVVWLTRRSYLQRAGAVLIDLTATPDRRVMAWLLLPPAGCALPWILSDDAEGSFLSIAFLGYGVYVAINWRRCQIREKRVTAFGFSNEWKNRPAMVVTSENDSELRIVLGGLGRWVVYTRAPIPPDRVDEVRAILTEKQGEEPQMDADKRG